MGTVEFRLFNGTTHAGEVKAHIQLCLAIAAKAKTAACASTKNQRLQPGKRQVRPPGLPPPPRAHRAGVQEHPDALDEADARFIRLEERQTGRPVKRNGGPGTPALL